MLPAFTWYTGWLIYVYTHVYCTLNWTILYVLHPCPEIRPLMSAGRVRTLCLLTQAGTVPYVLSNLDQTRHRIQKPKSKIGPGTVPINSANPKFRLQLSRRAAHRERSSSYQSGFGIYEISCLIK